ncbi:aldose 1-epimerase family protein [Beutenbergia cavernae]|uniref:aldose 1-epimerase family protein n=1 Tax=Beutenbergia cavernae TaxID=84757 RepID=UPI0002E84DFC|nr:aldose 1-epimerase family protein [Beutenbergia cavernae]
MSIDELLRFTAHDDQLADVATFRRDDGTGSGSRVMHVAPAGGIHARLLLDRGMDLGRAWFAGQPISWTAAPGPRSRGYADDDQGWHLGWEGGLVTTCGLQNVGSPADGHGQHGRFTENPAERVTVSGGAGDGRLVVTGVVHENNGIGRLLRVDRTWTFHLGSGLVELEDVTRNESPRAVQAPVLYHVNVGYPFLGPASEVATRGDGDAVVSTMGEPEDAADDVVELDVDADDEGWAAATVTSPRLGMSATIRWLSATLPRVHRWRRRAPGAYVMAIEPANCGVGGAAHDRAQGCAPILEPGTDRTTRLSIQLEQT